MIVRREIRLSGIVQGVGFRPYVYRLALGRKLAGSVGNTAGGVTIQVQGPAEAVADFLARLTPEAPPLARIAVMDVREVPCRTEDGGFAIVPSASATRAQAGVSPDVAVCQDCLRELFDPADRRFRYPFINCTNCGPRFTIVRGVPYDRARTAMSCFRMCPQCQAEYDSPENRRFHAQPNACWGCGPRAELWDAHGRALEAADAITAAAERLAAGQIVAVKGLGGFHFAVDAANGAAVERLRQRKRRYEKPLAVMVKDMAAAARCCDVDAAAAALLQSWQRPIVLVPRRAAAAVADAVAPQQTDLGLLLPYTPLHHLLFAAGAGAALVMTSGNLSEEPIAMDNAEAVHRLGRIADAFLVHNRDILRRCDDSVVRPAGCGSQAIRRSRGYVPAAVPLARTGPAVLAVGGEQKNTICLTRGGEAFLSQHIGDLENAAAFESFGDTLGHLRGILEVEPAIVAHDLHPGYLSTDWAVQWARERPEVRRIGVQHHHAHIAACMAEHRIEGRVIGLALDGTGYGEDGAIWGGEALMADYAGFERAGQLEYVVLPGGSAAVREPWRMAASYVQATFGAGWMELDLPFTRRRERNQAALLAQVIARRVNSPWTSSCGRLFDAVAALAGLRERVSYEGQAAIALEMAARGVEDAAAYPFEVNRGPGRWQLGARPMITAAVEDLRRGVAAETVARRFHNGLIAALAEMVAKLREQSGLERVCLSGGSFQNQILQDGLAKRLRATGMQVFTHAQVPANDGGLSLGQAAVAAAR